MALVVFLRGVNVGGYKTFRPSVLAKQLQRYDVVNVGAAGTFVIRKPVGQTKLRAEFKRRLPFAADVMICNGDDILRLAESSPFAEQPTDGSIIQFVSVLSKGRIAAPAIPLNLPSTGEWGLKVLSHQNPFVLGVYRRQMKAISYLGKLDKIFGVSVTTRNWNTILAIAKILKDTKGE